MAKTCPFCGVGVNQFDPAYYECSTLIDNDGDEERYRTHMCYMNQIRQLQTGETEYGQGFQDGVKAMRKIMEKAVYNEHDWLLKNPPMRRPGKRHSYDD